MYIRKNMNKDTKGHTLRNTMNPLSGFKSHEAYMIRANRLQES
jgi:hypothetical protein